jgi:hypothetical protein
MEEQDQQALPTVEVIDLPEQNLYVEIHNEVEPL